MLMFTKMRTQILYPITFTYQIQESKADFPEYVRIKQTSVC